MTGVGSQRHRKGKKKCAPVAFGIHQAMPMRYIVTCGLSGSTIFFTHYLTSATIFEETKSYWIRNVFWFSLQLFSVNISHSKIILVRSIKYVYRSSCKVPLLLSDFNESWIFSTHFKQILKFDIHGSVHRRWFGRNTNKMQLCNRIYYSKIYWRLNMFRAAHSVEITTRCNFVMEFITPKFTEGSTCFERHTQ